MSPNSLRVQVFDASNVITVELANLVRLYGRLHHSFAAAVVLAEVKQVAKFVRQDRFQVVRPTLIRVGNGRMTWRKFVPQIDQNISPCKVAPWRCWLRLS